MSERLEKIKEEAYWDGYREGKSRGYDKAENEYLPQLEKRNKIIKTLEKEKEQLELQISKLEGII